MEAPILVFLFSLNFVNSLISFDDWKVLYNVNYPDIESETVYEQAFEMNSAFISLVGLNTSSKFSMDLNKFADLAFPEFQNSHMGVVMPAASERGHKKWIRNRTSNSGSGSLNSGSSGTGSSGIVSGGYTLLNLPTSIDYRSVSLPVQDQYYCGACYAFAVASILESRMKILNPSYDKLLSEQYFVDCDTIDYGCDGGWPYATLYWLVVMAGNAVPSLNNYPYVGYQQTCASTSKITMNIASIEQNNTAGNELMLKQLVANIGPISVAIDATYYFQLYYRGILDDTLCDNTCSSVNHAVVVVGYGTDPNSNRGYWIVKNSWGTSWGDAGYIYMSRNADNQCNIACWAMYAV